MAMNPATQGYALPCGRDMEQLWQRLEELGNDPHERDCPHCRAAHGSLQLLREATAELRHDTPAPSQDLTSRIMAAVRAEVRRRELLPLPTHEPGGARISERVVAAILRFAADTVPGVRARHCRVTTRPGTKVEVEMELAVRYPDTTGAALNLVRERVPAAAGARIGVEVARLDVSVTDLYDG
ncbi:Asp23/Gls24 family envelope stress response protein [Amycolatopsis thermoflava]|uniref:Asp23/Gls24 family envelope stress response protein n=1 Tax=Amycolatopsis thermoflava TaxID=84480 RepID=UPI003812B479